MCIICAKPAKLSMPSHEVIQRMWQSNPDGAGFMYAMNGRVVIEKGFMTLSALEARLAAVSEKVDLTAVPVVLHFRIGTAGGNTPENTHPFPITDSIPALRKLRMEAPVGVAHNGIIHVTPRQKNISDTMEYIASQLAPLHRAVREFYRDKNLMQMVENAISSKMVFLTKKGEIFTIGEFVNDGGLLFSNSSYKVSPLSYRGLYGSCYSLDGYEDLYDDWDSCYLDLMILEDKDEFAYLVDSETGECFGSENGLYAVDGHDNVYQYDMDGDTDTFLLAPELTAMRANGELLHFDEGLAVSMPVTL